MTLTFLSLLAIYMFGWANLLRWSLLFFKHNLYKVKIWGHTYVLYTVQYSAKVRDNPSRFRFPVKMAVMFFFSVLRKEKKEKEKNYIQMGISEHCECITFLFISTEPWISLQDLLINLIIIDHACPTSRLPLYLTGLPANGIKHSSLPRLFTT